MSWRYLARRLNGDGTETKLHPGLPLSDVGLDRELSGPGGMTAALKPEFYGLRAADGKDLFVPWSTAVYAEHDGVIRRGCILTDVEDDGPDLALSFTGFSGYPKNQPFNAEYTGVQVDPLDVTRLLWTHLQEKPGGNLGLQLGTTKTPIRMGKALPAGQDNPNAGEDGPYTLGYWETKDISAEIDALATATPFDYREHHEWVGETDTIRHRLEFGYPTFNARRTDLRFVVGENVVESPKIEYEGDDYATAVIMLGAGEGRKMIRGISVQEGTPGRLRRVLTLEDRSLKTKAAADRAAQQQLALRQGLPDFKTLVVSDHESAPLFSYDVGDEIEITTRGGWNNGLNLWVRIIAISTDPEKMEDTLTVLRTDKVN